MLKRHNWRWIAARTEKKGQDPLVDEILANPDGPKAELYKECLLIQEKETKPNLKRQYLEACLFCSEDLNKISEVLELPLDLVEMYATMFYDVKGYDRLSKLDMLDKIKEKDELALKTWALHQGMEFIAWRLGKHVIISPTEGLNELFNTCMYKSKEALFNSNSTAASIESTKWVKLSLDIARLLKLWTTDNGGARKDLELAIREVLPNFKSLDDIMNEVQAENLDVSADETGEEEDNGSNDGSN